VKQLRSGREQIHHVTMDISLNTQLSVKKPMGRQLTQHLAI
jgi:hypothetical protein